MADTDTDKGVKSRVETAVVAGDKVTSVEMGYLDKPASASSRTDDSASMTFDMTSKEPLPQEYDPVDDADAEELEDNPEKPEGEGEADKPDEEGDEVDAPEDLGEYNPEDPSKFDERYFKDGKLDQKALSDEFWANFAKAEDKGSAALNANTLAYLEDRLGLSPEFVKQTCDALVLKAQAETSKVYERVGGQERFQEMVQWGKDGGYTPAQRERFNAAMQKGGEDFEDALDALALRFEKANGGGDTKPIKGPKGPPPGRTKRSSPERNVTQRSTGGTQTSADVFATRAEHQAAWQEGLKRQHEASTDKEKQDAANHLSYLQRKARRSKNMK